METNLLHTHPEKEKALGLDDKHVIVDQEAWEKAVDLFSNPKDFKTPTFKHTRGNTITAVFGRLSEDAAQIAMEEFLSKAKKKEFIESMKKTLEEQGGFSDSRLLELICEYANNTEELILHCFAMGRMVSDFNNPFIRTAYESHKTQQT